jgi:hypothetical protein
MCLQLHKINFRVRRHYYHWFDQLCVIEDNEVCIIIFLSIFFSIIFLLKFSPWVSIHQRKLIKIFNHVHQPLTDPPYKNWSANHLVFLSSHRQRCHHTNSLWHWTFIHVQERIGRLHSYHHDLQTQHDVLSVISYPQTMMINLNQNHYGVSLL